jgi:hypothetical protein
VHVQNVMNKTRIGLINLVPQLDDVHIIQDNVIGLGSQDSSKVFEVNIFSYIWVVNLFSINFFKTY